MRKNLKALILKLTKENIELKKLIDEKEKAEKRRIVESEANLQSAELALEAVRVEYEAVCVRSNELTARSGNFLSVMLIAFTFAISGIAYDILFDQNVLLHADWRYGVFLSTSLCCVACAITALVLLSLSVVTKPFHRLDCEKLNNEKNISMKKGVVAKSIISIYTKSIDVGEAINSSKAKLFNWGVWTGVAAILFTVIIQIMQSILKGVYYG